MKKPLLLWIALLVVIGLTLSACVGTASVSLAGTWKLISHGSSTNPTPAEPNVEASLIFGSDGKLNGNMGCNGFGGDYKVDGSSITFGTIASTLMACADPVMRQESAAFNVLANTAAFKLEGNQLTITSFDGNSVMVLERK